jgi:hypothetical protein
VHGVAGDDGDGIKTTNATKCNQAKKKKPNNMKTKITLMAAIPALLLVVVGYAQSVDTVTHPIELDAVTHTWKVTAVNPTERTVMFRNEAGEGRKYELSEGGPKFDQIRVGDTVKATLAEPVALTIRKSSAPRDASERTTVAVAPKGEGQGPGVIMAKTKEITGKIASVDTTAQTVTIQGPDGGTETLKTGPGVKLDQFQTGDDVTLRVTVRLVLRVQ